MILDVGCGPHPMGDVNADLKKPEWNNGFDSKRDCQNLVLCDGQSLPFKDDSFNTTRSSHLIEHVESPMKLIHELCRVSSNNIMIICPHRFSSNAKRKDHRYALNVGWFEKALQMMQIFNYRITTTQRYMRPYDIVVEITKANLR